MGTIAGLCVFAGLLVAVLSSAQGFNLTLVHTADTYSALSAVDASSTSCQPVNGSYVTSGGQLACFGGVARMKTVIDQQRARSDTNVFVVDAGNIIATSLYYYVAGPSLVASYYAQLGYDLVHPQVQDFVLPVENVAEFMRVARAQAPALGFVVSNLEGYNEDPRANGTFVARWAYKTFAGGQRVGYAATVASNLATMVRTPLAIRATDEAAALSVAVMALINQGANKIVASVSSNATAEAVLSGVPGIDVLIVPTQLQANDRGTAADDVRAGAVGPYPMVVATAWEQPVLVVSSGTYGRLIGVLDVEFDDYGVVTGWSGDARLMDESVAADPAVQAQLLANYAQLQANFSQTVGWSALDLGFETNCLFAECAIAGWMGDAVRDFAARAWGGNVQIAFNNGGSVRGTFARGPVTLGQQQTAFPFGSNSELYTYQLAGRYVWAALENGLSLATDPSADVNNGAGRFMQVSGLRYSWNPSEEVGFRVVDVEVEAAQGVWARLDMDAVYNVSSFDWLVIYGGDDYTMIRDNSTRLFNNGANMNSVLLDALARNITSVETGRVTTTSATRRACLAPDGSVCSGNGVCVAGACQCTVAGTSSERLCASSNGTAAASSDSSSATLAIALGVSLPIAALLVLLLVVALVVARLRRRREHNSWEIDFAELEMGPQLGAGGFGEVHRAVWKGTDVAVKVVSAHNTNKAAWDDFKQEVSVMTALRHPNVVLFMAASTKPPKMCIVMELMELGSLYDLLHNELVPAIPLQLCLKMAYQAAKGMHFLHSSGIVHRDLKSLNLLLDNKWNLKVSDFGLTKFKADLKRAGGHDVQGTIHWTSPEVLEDRMDIDYVQADVYSFGIIMWELMTREQPYAGVSTAAIAVGVIRDALRPTDLQASDSGAQRHVEFEALMAECWHADPSVRPSFLEVMSRLSAMSEDMTGHDTNSMTTSGSSSSTYMGQGSASFYNTAKHSASAGSTASSTSSSHISSRSGGSAKAAAAGGKRNNHGQRGVGQPPAPAVDGPLTVVFTDVAQAAQLWEAEPQAMREAVAMHNELLRRLIKQHCGYESVFLHQHNTGAAGGEGYFCVVFGRPLDALRWCDEVQRELLTLEWPPALLGVLYAREEVAGVADGVLFRGPRVRMGVHHGPISRMRDPVSNRFEYFGAAVKVATELTLRAEGGHVLVSDVVISAVEALSEPVTDSNGGDDDVALDKDRALYGRQRFQQVGAVEVMVANGGSMLEVEVHDMRLSGLEDRCQAWEQAGSSSNHTSARSGTTTHTGGSSTTSSGGGSSRPRLLVRPDEVSYIGSSNACRWIIPFEDLAIQEAHVGQGSYGFVSQGRWKGVDVAVKRFVKQRLDEDTMLRFREEAALLAELRHPNVVLFIGACVRSPNICIVTEWIPKGSLRDVLADGSVKLSWATRLNVVKGIALGLAYLHSQQPAPILHRDLKSSNVLVDESWNAKIADFGLARMKQENATMTRCGTPAWIAPEVVMRERYTEKADLYSLGMVMWEVATRKLPFAGENLAKTAVDIVEGKRPPMPANAPKAYVALMTACWHRKPHKRPSAEQVCRTIESWLDNTASGEVNLV